MFEFVKRKIEHFFYFLILYVSRGEMGEKSPVFALDGGELV